MSLSGLNTSETCVLFVNDVIASFTENYGSERGTGHSEESQKGLTLPF